MPDRLFTMWHTSTVDGQDHAITDEVMAAGLSEECAPITAVCGDLVLLTLMEEPPGERCRRCIAFLRARATLRDFEQRERHRHRKPGLVARLLHLAPETPVGPERPRQCSGPPARTPGGGRSSAGGVSVTALELAIALWPELGDLWVFGPDDAHGVRCMVGGAVTWTQEGAVAAVLTALTRLPLPGQPGAPLAATDSFKGYGFINADNGTDVFGHCTAIQGTGFRCSLPGDHKVCSAVRSGDQSSPGGVRTP